MVDPATRSTLVVDPALDYDPASGTSFCPTAAAARHSTLIDVDLCLPLILIGHISTETASGLLAFVKQEAYSVARVLETHVHADHLSVRPSSCVCQGTSSRPLTRSLRFPRLLVSGKRCVAAAATLLLFPAG